MRLFVLIWLILLLVFTVGFIMFNLDKSSDVNLYFREPYQYQNVPIPLIVIFSVLFGVIYTGIIALVEGMNLRLTNLRLKKTIKKLEEDIDRLRGLSLSQVSEEPADSITHTEMK